ncbi:MAG: hypothetical protein KDD78_10105, partial [Caldilineaceae bacterium]|nr:hypothetical protein [Caldilineaceae bacterium]
MQEFVGNKYNTRRVGHWAYRPNTVKDGWAEFVSREVYATPDRKSGPWHRLSMGQCAMTVVH